jgi:hypothetical protein
MQGDLREPLVSKSTSISIEMVSHNDTTSETPAEGQLLDHDDRNSNRSPMLSRHAFALAGGLFSFLLGAIIEVSADNVFSEAASKAYNLDDLATGLLQVLGLIFATSADIDADVWARHNPYQVILLLCMWTAYLGIEMFTAAVDSTEGNFEPLRQVFWLPALPSLFVLGELLVLELDRNQRTKQFSLFSSANERASLMVSKPWENSQRCFTKVFSLTIAFDLISRGLYNLLIAAYRPEKHLGGGARGGDHGGVQLDPTVRWPSWPYYVYGFYELGGSIAMAVAFRWSPWKRYTGRMNLTMRMHMAIYAFLFTKGTQYIMSAIFNFFFIENAVVDIYQWFYGPIYILPTTWFLWFHVKIKRDLGRRWIRRRILQANRLTNLFSALPKSRGNLREVNEAIAKVLLLGGCRHDLNKFVFDAVNDSYVLLHLATLNDYPAAIKRLLEVEDDDGMRLVDINRGSRVQGWSALFIAARNDNAEAVSILLEYGSDVNQKTNEGYTALLIAAQKEHKKIVPLLLEGGATNAQAFMGLTAFDIAAETPDAHAMLHLLRGYESHFAGNILEGQGPSFKCAVSWPGVYAKSWDVLVNMAKKDSFSAAVVFLPENTIHFGKHGRDKCYCKEVRALPRAQLSYNSNLRLLSAFANM